MSSDSCCCEYPCVSDESWRQLFSLSRKNSEITHQIFASSTGSIVTAVVLNPLSVIKVRLQNQKNTTVKSIVDGALREKRLARTLWSGTSSGLMLSLPNTVSYMVAYERLKLFFREQLSESLSIVTPALSGTVARAFSVSLLSPLELARTVQTSGVNKSVLSIWREITAIHGSRGVYRGWASTILRDCPYSAVYWFSLENMRPHIEKNFFRDSTSNQDLLQGKFHPMTSFIAGASAGLFAALCTHPFDVLKTRRQLSLMDPNSPQSENIVSIYKSNGLQGFFRGLSMRLLTVIPASAIMITIYEYCKL